MWLLENSVYKLMESALALGLEISAEQQVEFMAQVKAFSSGDRGVLKIQGGQNVISIDGILTAKPDFLAMLIGGGNITYPDISAAIVAGEQDDAVDSHLLQMGHCPGGTMSGLFSLIDVLQAATKPVFATVENMAASAAYAVVSQAQNIRALNDATIVGSVGVLVDSRVDPHTVTIASDKAPKKAPDPQTPEGVGVIKETLNKAHNVFVDTIAAGRGTTAEDVNNNYGQGALVLAQDAVKYGMIDQVGSVQKSPSKNKTTASVGGNNDGGMVQMDLQKLKAEHPELYAQVVQIGVTEEREVACAHLRMGEASGDMATAMKSIREGVGFTPSVIADYNAAAMKRNEIAARGTENPPAVPPVEGGVETLSSHDQLGEQVVALVEEQLGLELEDVDV